MRVQFERKGGFTGIPVQATVEVDTLPENERQLVLDSVAKSDFFALPGKISAPRPVPDTFYYKITVESDQGSHLVEVDEVAAPQSLKPLLQVLTRMAQSTRRM